MAKIKKLLPDPAVATKTFVAVMLWVLVVATGLSAAVDNRQPRFAAMAAGLKADSLILLALSPLVVNGQMAGTVGVYDDPATRRPADYLEVVDGQGALVVASWFDRFGIERLVIDRALIEGGNRLKGEFVAVLDGEPT